MSRADEIVVEIEDVSSSTPPVVLVVISTPVAEIRVLGSVWIAGRILHVDGAHIEGSTAGTFGRAGLNAIGRKLLEITNVDEIVLQGGTRTTGANKGRDPRPIRFPKR